MKKTVTYFTLSVLLFEILACTKNKAEIEALQTWVQKTTFPAAGRHHPITFTIDGFGYTGMGSFNRNYFDDFYKYDPIKDSWTKLNVFKGAKRAQSYGISYNSLGYMGFGTNEQEETFVKDWWRYNPKSDSWEELKSCSCEARSHPVMLAIDGKIYVGLGSGDNHSNLNDWWEYDIASNNWAKKANFPAAGRHHPFFFSINGLAYVGFGHGSEIIGGVNIYKDFYQYSPKADTWKKLKDFPSEGRVAGTQFEYNGNGYILSGQGEHHQNFNIGEFWKYNPQSDSWSVLPPHNGSSRWAPGSFLIDKKLFFVGGQSNTNYHNDLWQFVLE